MFDSSELGSFRKSELREWLRAAVFVRAEDSLRRHTKGETDERALVGSG